MGEARDKWRVGEHYGIHVYRGDEPIATFHNARHAAVAVHDHNALRSNETVERVARAIREADPLKHVGWDAGGMQRSQLLARAVLASLLTEEET